MSLNGRRTLIRGRYWDAYFVSTIGMHRAGRVLQQPAPESGRTGLFVFSDSSTAHVLPPFLYTVSCPVAQGSALAITLSLTGFDMVLLLKKAPHV